MRAHLDLNGLWRFQLDVFRHGEQLGYAAPSFDDSGWRPGPVPGAFPNAMPQLELSRANGWYRRAFDIPAAWAGKRILLQFGAVNYHCRVFVNGSLAAEHRDGFIPFEIDITGQAQPGAANCLALLVDNCVRFDGDLPGHELGWRSYAGILRDVALAATGQVRLDDVRIDGAAAEDGGRLAMRGTIHNSGRGAWTGRVAAELGDDTPGASLAALTTEPIAVRPGSSSAFSLEGLVRGAALWSPETPALYRVRVRLEGDGGVIDGLERRTGFRTLDIRDARIRLNGKPIFLKGFNRHEDSPGARMAKDPATVRRDLTDMKAMGANFVRFAHYPHDPCALDVCDELGLLAMGEVPLYSLWDPKSRSPEVLPQKLASAERMLEAMIRRDTHHPSIAFWSVSNETWDEVEAMARGNAALIRKVKALDPTRFAVHVSHRWPTAPRFEEDDVICINDYPTVVHGEKDAHYDPAKSAAYWTDGINALHARFPAKPILVTEFGFFVMDGMRGGVGGEDVQARVLETEGRGMLASPHCRGFAQWLYADHPWPGGMLGLGAIAPYGVVSRDRRRRRQSYETMKRLFRLTPAARPPA